MDLTSECDPASQVNRPAASSFSTDDVFCLTMKSQPVFCSGSSAAPHWPSSTSISCWTPYSPDCSTSMLLYLHYTVDNYCFMKDSNLNSFWLWVSANTFASEIRVDFRRHFWIICQSCIPSSCWELMNCDYAASLTDENIQNDYI